MSENRAHSEEGIAWMAEKVASIADNKAALGRRYGEWAVSAPSLESAVAAAAMAQDELGHARSTYPVLKALGIEGEEDPGGADRCLSLLATEFSDWSEFIAANLVVDGTLTTFIAACQESSVEQLAQRAKKILQEEGSHRAHAEAWARRLCREGGSQRERFLAEVEAAWEATSQWLGPVDDDDAAADAAFELGLIRLNLAQQRALMRGWLTELLAAEGVELRLADAAPGASCQA